MNYCIFVVLKPFQEILSNGLFPIFYIDHGHSKMNYNEHIGYCDQNICWQTIIYSEYSKFNGMGAEATIPSLRGPKKISPLDVATSGNNRKLPKISIKLPLEDYGPNLRTAWIDDCVV